MLVEPFRAIDDVLDVDFWLFHLLLLASPVARSGDQESGEKYECGGQDRGPQRFGSHRGMITKGHNQLKQTQRGAQYEAQNAEHTGKPPNGLFLDSNDNTHQVRGWDVCLCLSWHIPPGYLS